MKTYTTKANAKRAARTAVKAASINDDQYSLDVTGEDGAYRAVITIPFGCEDLGADQLEQLEASDNYDITYEGATAESEAQPEDLAPADVDTTPTDEEMEELQEAPKASGNYIHEKSDHGGVCAQVWAIADSMPGAKRKDVIAKCREEGIAYGTARTQYQKWKNRAQ